MDLSVTRSIVIVACCVASLLIQPGSFAQLSTPEIRFKRLSVEHGLSQSTVNAILQDNQGYMWFGTQDGLNRYDGYEFVVYRHDERDSLSLSDNYVTCLFEDAQNNLWVGTYGGGINILDRVTGTFRRMVRGPAATGGLSGNSIMSVVGDRTGAIWAAIWNNGINRYDPRLRQWTHFRHDSGDPGSLVDDRVRNLFADRTGRLWVCTFGGLDRFDSLSGKFVHYRAAPPGAPGLPDNRVMCAFEDREGDLWFGTFESGVALFDRRRAEFVEAISAARVNSVLGSKRIMSISQGDDSTIWIATWHAGLSRLEKTSGRIWIHQHTDDDPHSLSGDQARSMYRDRTGGIWIGTDGAGVNHYDPSRFKFRHLRHHKSNPRSLGNPVIRALCEDREGVLWVGSQGGVDSYDARTGDYAHYRVSAERSHSLSSNIVLAILEDSDGHLWFGTDGGGLNLFDRRTRSFRNFRSDPRNSTTIGSDYIMTLVEGRDGSLWIGTAGGGLTCMNRRTFACHRYTRTKDAPDQLSGNYIYAIHEDPSGELWLGTWGAGITVWNPNTMHIRYYRHEPSQPNSLSNNTVHDFHRDARGNLWIATMGGGLDRFDSSSGGFFHLTDADGLPNNVLYGIEEDSTGRLWISTNNGISCYDLVTKTFRNYGLGDGTQSVEFNQGAFCKGSGGRLYFGGINGVNSITPDRLPEARRASPTVITQIKVMDREVPVPGYPQHTLDLAPDENFLSFMFSVLDFAAPDQNTYRYMLEGLDREWIEAGTRRYAAYTDMKPGEYVLRVEGRNSDGAWNREGATLRIHVRPPFWDTPWFRALVIAAILGMGFGFYRDRTRRLQREKAAQAEFSRKLNEFQENERKRIAGELHDSLGQTLLIIKNRLSQCEAIGGQAETLQLEIRDISGTVQQTIEDVREISADLHPHMLDRLGLTRTIESTVKKCAAASGMKMQTAIDDVDHLFSAVEEINIFRVVQEGLNNVVKHSRASECRVGVRKAERTCDITIEDDGCGFVPAQLEGPSESYGGFGLMHMAERVRLLHGSMGIVSSSGNGAIIRISLPVPEKVTGGKS